jgi:hypothetical protein
MVRQDVLWRSDIYKQHQRTTMSDLKAPTYKNQLANASH